MRSLHCALVVVLLLATPRVAVAVGFDEVPQPEDLAPLPLRLPTSFFVMAGPMMVFPRGDAGRLNGSSLGWRAGMIRWLHPQLGIIGSVEYTVLAKEPVLADALALALFSLNAGVRAQTAFGPGVHPFAEAQLGRHTVSLTSRGQRRSKSDLGARLGAGLDMELSPYIHLVVEASYSIARPDTIAVEVVIGRAF